ncbi:alpha-L-rhamnosidase-related protein [Acidicapsa ligni]|uniref:alpha-L-rhamnosidase-related protein n=1 Tax=Acidicapsa ligni TaxID=542300 RepID=UPI0021DFE115|nr:alpha-L-rhamnosidase C-terminal domain-containing protein [Acidicapsa ligni]
MRVVACSRWVSSALLRSILLRSMMLSALAVTLVGGTWATAQSGKAEEGRRGWSAQWISHPTAPLREPITLHFKKTLDIASAPAHYLVEVSADNRFVLYLNGERVGDGPARGDMTHWRYETFDLGPMLKPGANVIAATVWNFGTYAPVAQISDRTAFLVQGDTKAEEAVNTNSTWMVEEEPGQVLLPRRQNGLWVYYAAGPGETLKGSEYDWDWMKADAAPGSKWVAAGPALREDNSSRAGIAASREVTADVPWALVQDTLPHMAYTKEDAGHVVRVTGTLQDGEKFPAAPVTIAAHSTVHLMLDRSELTTAYPKLMFSGGKGSHVTLTYAEALYDAEKHKGNRNEVGTRQALGYVDEVVPDGGAHRVFEPLWWRTWRYVDVAVETADEPLTLDGMEAHFTAYPFETKAQLETGDADLQKIWEIGWHTARLDAHETYMDTPYYEQLQYAGDTRIQAMITYAMTGDDRLPRQAIRALNDSRVPAGITTSRYPESLPQMIPPFSLLWIGMLHDNYMYRPDTEFVKSILPGTRTVLDWFASYQHADGLLGKTPWWNFVDWIEVQKEFPSYDKQNGETCLVTMQYISALQDAIDLESALGSKEHVQIDRARLDAAIKGERTLCWDASRKLMADSPAKDIFSQHTNMLGVLYDVVPRSEQAEVMRQIVGHELGDSSVKADPDLITASYYFRYYLARALDHAGMADEYLKTLGSWHEFLKEGFSTWPEQPGNTRSDSHAWSAHPTFDLLTLVAGISPASPGFRTVRVAPHLGELTHLEASFPAPQGLIHVKYAEANATVDLPQGLTGTFVWKGKETKLHAGENLVPMK